MVGNEAGRVGVRIGAGSGAMLSTCSPGTPSVSHDRWQARQRSLRVNRGSPSVSCGSRVEDHALPRILRRDLQELGVAHPADGDAVVEEDRPRVVRGDEVVLVARGREDRHLRLDRHVQRVEHRAEVAAAALERQIYLTGREPPVELRDGVVDRPVGVADGRVVARRAERASALPRHLGGDGRRGEQRRARQPPARSSSCTHLEPRPEPSPTTPTPSCGTAAYTSGSPPGYGSDYRANSTRCDSATACTPARCSSSR